MRKNDGGPAFPSGQGDFYKGISLRDYFAASSLNGFLSDASPNGLLSIIVSGPAGASAEAISSMAYELADAMIEARNK